MVLHCMSRSKLFEDSNSSLWNSEAPSLINNCIHLLINSMNISLVSNITLPKSEQLSIGCTIDAMQVFRGFLWTGFMRKDNH